MTSPPKRTVRRIYKAGSLRVPLDHVPSIMSGPTGDLIRRFKQTMKRKGATAPLPDPDEDARPRTPASPVRDEIRREVLPRRIAKPPERKDDEDDDDDAEILRRR